MLPYAMQSFLSRFDSVFDLTIQYWIQQALCELLQLLVLQRPGHGLPTLADVCSVAVSYIPQPAAQDATHGTFLHQVRDDVH